MDQQKLKEQPEFKIKDSGQRTQFESGMVRDVTTDKTNVSLVFDGPMFWRWAVHLTKGAIKYAKRNWMKASGEEELERFKESAARHFQQWYRGDVDEDHASAVFFNINGAEYVKEKLSAKKELPPGTVITFRDPNKQSGPPIYQYINPNNGEFVYRSGELVRDSVPRKENR